jgi:hypothetical protein
MVGRFVSRPKPGRIRENADGEVIFRGSEGLWLTLAGVAVLVGVMAIWLVISTIASQGVGASVTPILVGLGISAFLLLGAWFARGQRREVVLDGNGVTVRTREGRVTHHLAWEQVTRIESRFLPSHPLQPGIMLHCVDGTSHFIDPLQVYDTSTLVFEAERRKKIADEAARAARLMEHRSVGDTDPGEAVNAET